MAMHRQKQYNMFDVVTGACTLDDYLNQRYSESDLSSKFWIDKNDQVDELRQPKEPDPSGVTKPVIVPIQRPANRPPAPEPPSPTSAPPGPAPQATSQDRRETAPVEVPSRESRVQAPPPPTADPQDTVHKSVQVPTGGISLADLAKGGTSSAPPAEEAQEKPAMNDLLAQFQKAKEAHQGRDGESAT